jgi:hypothetical protein
MQLNEIYEYLYSKERIQIVEIKENKRGKKEVKVKVAYLSSPLKDFCIHPYEHLEDLIKKGHLVKK